jgi:Flp pilus assembly pilin Flp
MKKVINYFNKLKTKGLMKPLGNEEGIVAIEYGLIAAAIAVAIYVTVWAIGDRLVVLFGQILTALG